MIPEDKFGNPIYEHIYKILLQNARCLLSVGYKESKAKPNLFFRNDDKRVVFFADMRSSEVVPIWEDTSPLFYYQFNAEMPDWEKRRILNEELRQITNAGCLCRLSFEETLISSNVGERGGDGFCMTCGKDFQNEGEFCSKECEKAYGELHQTRCAKCGKLIDWGSGVKHHISYEPEKTIEICKSCHLKIHKSKENSALKPTKDSSKRYYSQKPRKKGVIRETELSEFNV